MNKHMQIIALLVIAIAMLTTSRADAQPMYHSPNEERPRFQFVRFDGKRVFTVPAGISCEKFVDGRLRIVADDQVGKSSPRCSYLDQHGQFVAKNIRDGSNFSEGFARFRTANQTGFIAYNGATAIAPIFEEAGAFKEGLAPVRVNDGCGFIDHSGQFVIDPFFKNVSLFSEGLAAAEAQGKIGFIDTSGTWKIKPKFTRTSGFFDGLALVAIGYEFSVIDKSGTVIIDKMESDNYWIANLDHSHYGLRSTENAFYERRHWRFDEPFVHWFSEGLAPTRAADKKWGYIDRSGKFAISAQFEYAGQFSNGRARVRVNNKIGFIDKTGKIVIEPKFARAEDFSESRAVVAIGHHKWGHIDTVGNIVTPLIYAHTESFSDGLAKVQISGSYKD